MALPSPGQSIAMDQVNTELGSPATTTIGLNDAAVRTLFGVSSGAISLSDGWGAAAGGSIFASSYWAPTTMMYNDKLLQSQRGEHVGKKLTQPLTGTEVYTTTPSTMSLWSAGQLYTAPAQISTITPSSPIGRVHFISSHNNKNYMLTPTSPSTYNHLNESSYSNILVTKYGINSGSFQNYGVFSSSRHYNKVTQAYQPTIPANNAQTRRFDYTGQLGVWPNNAPIYYTEASQLSGKPDTTVYNPSQTDFNPNVDWIFNQYMDGYWRQFHGAPFVPLHNQYSGLHVNLVPTPGLGMLFDPQAPWVSEYSSNIGGTVVPGTPLPSSPYFSVQYKSIQSPNGQANIAGGVISESEFVQIERAVYPNTQGGHSGSDYWGMILGLGGFNPGSMSHNIVSGSGVTPTGWIGQSEDYSHGYMISFSNYNPYVGGYDSTFNYIGVTSNVNMPSGETITFSSGLSLPNMTTPSWTAPQHAAAIPPLQVTCNYHKEMAKAFYNRPNLQGRANVKDNQTLSQMGISNMSNTSTWRDLPVSFRKNIIYGDPSNPYFTPQMSLISGWNPDPATTGPGTNFARRYSDHAMYDTKYQSIVVKDTNNNIKIQESALSMISYTTTTRAPTLQGGIIPAVYNVSALPVTKSQQGWHGRMQENVCLFNNKLMSCWWQNQDQNYTPAEQQAGIYVFVPK